MTSVALFGRLQEHGLKLGRLLQHEEQEKKHKNISLKVESNVIAHNDDLDGEENSNLLVKKFVKFLRRDKTMRFKQERRFEKKNETSTSNQNLTCFECIKVRTRQRQLSISSKEK